MVKHPFGNTGMQVSPIGLGTVKWGRNEGVKFGRFELPTDDVLELLLSISLEHGINVIDTAPAYGIAEERIGRVLGARRGQFHIFSKTGEVFAGGKSTYDFSAEHTRKSVEESLRKLRTEYLDGVLVHCPADDLGTLQHTPVLETLATLKAQGKIRTFGASIMTIEGGLCAVEKCDVVMVAYNYGFSGHVPVIEAAAANGRGVLLKKVFYSGVLPSAEVTGGRLPGEYCVHSALKLPGHPVVVAGTISPEHLLESVHAAGMGAATEA